MFPSLFLVLYLMSKGQIDVSGLGNSAQEQSGDDEDVNIGNFMWDKQQFKDFSKETKSNTV